MIMSKTTKHPEFKPLADIVKAARERTGETYEQFGARFGLSRTDIWKYENTVNSPSALTLLKSLKLIADFKYNKWRLPADIFSDL